MPPQKNPYLTQYKENISNQQKLLRQRIGLPQPIKDQQLRETEFTTTSTRNSSYRLEDIDDDIPSIDDDNNIILSPPTPQLPTTLSASQSKHNLRNQVSSSSLYRSSNLDHDHSPLTNRRAVTAAIVLERGNYQTPPKHQLEKSQIRNNSYSNNDIGGSIRYKYFSNLNYEKGLKPTPTTTTTTTTTTTDTTSKNTDFGTGRQHDIPDYGPRHPSSGSRTPTRPLTSSFSSLIRAADELELARGNSLARRKSPTNEQQHQSMSSSAMANHRTVPSAVSPVATATTVDSPIPESVSTFSRRPIYNSLLNRAHDSIRLKVNRPKVRSKSDSSAKGPPVPDTMIDDAIQLVDLAKPKSNSTELNERAVDVNKRRSSRKSKKMSKKVSDSSKNDEQQQQQQQQIDEVPVRQFSEVRVVRVERSPDERALGVTVKADNGNIVVARILAGSLADKQGALQVGDLILSVNGREVYTPEQMQEQLKRTLVEEDVVLLKIVPSFREELPTLCMYLRALFQYDPNEDSLLPCKEVGVAFNQGDILEVVNQEDPNWWQARRVDSDNLQTGLIPSQELEERRRAFVLPDFDLATRTSICGTKVSKKSKKKEIYNVGQNNDFDKAELQLYEEVCRTPAFERRTLVLIGSNGVGKQAFKHRLVANDSDRFGTPLPHTSRLARDGEYDGVHYHFVTRERMEEDILAGRYLEYGEYDGALYGTKLDSVREIIGSGKVCVLDCSPTCLKVLKTSDYLPFVAFIAAPTVDQLRFQQQDYGRTQRTYATLDRTLSRQSRRAKTLQDFAFEFFEDEDLQMTVEESARLFRIYENYFDIVLVNNNFEATFEALRQAIDALSMAPQWIPISWIYGT